MNIWQNGDVTLYLGDCMDVMKGMHDNSVDTVITDPPYGIKRDKGFVGFGGFGGFGTPIARTRYQGNWDNERPHKKYFDEIQRVSKIALIFGGNYFSDLLPVGNHWIVWDKKQTMPTFGDCELVWTNVSRNSVKWIQREWNGLLGKEENRQHATQKPLKIMSWIIVNYTKEDNLILDPFMGSGTTGVACVQTGRKFIGIEIDPKYFEIAKKRISEAQMQLRLGI
jgi:DNA modification methylase